MAYTTCSMAFATCLVIAATAAGAQDRALGAGQATVAAEQDRAVFIAGVAPDRRPEGAPVIASFPKDAAWYENALAGVVPPYPYNLRFLEDEGAWFTPFNRPGMTGPYDIRGWH